MLSFAVKAKVSSANAPARTNTIKTYVTRATKKPIAQLICEAAAVCHADTEDMNRAACRLISSV
jgi:hypothetical protein